MHCHCFQFCGFTDVLVKKKKKVHYSYPKGLISLRCLLLSQQLTLSLLQLNLANPFIFSAFISTFPPVRSGRGSPAAPSPSSPAVPCRTPCRHPPCRTGLPASRSPREKPGLPLTPRGPPQASPEPPQPRSPKAAVAPCSCRPALAGLSLLLFSCLVLLLL